MFILNIFFFVPVLLCSAKIKINFKVASDKANTKLQYTGHDDKLIIENDIDVFNVTDENLKRGARVELGKFPDEIFLKNPTPYGDVFKEFKWQEVNRNVKVKNITILQLLKDKVTMKGLEIINNTTVTTKHKTNILERVENFSYSSWQNGGLPEDDTNYEISIKFQNGELKYDNVWRNNSLRSVNLQFGVTNEGNVEVNSGQTVVLKLKALKVFLLLKVTYEAKLFGNMFANFFQQYGSHHFWAPSLGDIMLAAGINNSIETNEYVEIRFFTDPKLKIFDKDTGKVVHTDKQLRLLRNRLILRPSHKP